MYLLNLDPEGYLLSVYQSNVDPEDTPHVETLDDLDLSGSRINAYRWDGQALVFDEARYTEIVSAEQEAAAKQEVSQADRIEAQVYYTAMMTDTLMEE